jgi:hypothetical protein
MTHFCDANFRLMTLVIGAGWGFAYRSSRQDSIISLLKFFVNLTVWISERAFAPQREI